MTGLVKLGFMPLDDAAGLIAAKALGFFADEGLNVELSREASWATIRDKVAVGALDGAHMLAPMVLAQSLGIGSEATPMIAPLASVADASSATGRYQTSPKLSRARYAAVMSASIEPWPPSTLASLEPWEIAGLPGIAVPALVIWPMISARWLI